MHGDTGKRLYLTSDIEQKLGICSDVGESAGCSGERILYARVSSSKQKEDLERQINDLRQSYSEHDRIIHDIGSGANFKRRGLRSLLERVYEGMVREVVVMHLDRLSRIGSEILVDIFKKFGTKLVVHCEGKEDETDKHDDLISIITLFVASHNGRRAAENKKRRKTS